MLTDTQCRNAKPKDKPYKLTDGNGLFLEVKPNGVKAWRYRFELVSEGVRKENLFAIGEYVYVPAGETPAQAQARRGGARFTLAEAREERTKARALVKQGINPAHRRQLERIQRAQASAVTFEAVAREWLGLKDWEQVTKDRRLDMLARVVFPKIGRLAVDSIKPAHILDVLKAAAEKNGPTVAAEAKRTMSGVFELAVSTLRAETDPVYAVRKALPANKTQHKRPLSTEEVGQLLRDLDGYERNFQTVAAFRLMWMTLCRPNEVVGARWDEMNLDAGIWRIPPERMKKRKEQIVPLPRQAIEMLRTQQAVTGRHAHVFPNRDDRAMPMTDATLRQALKYLGWSGKYSPHATRTTGSTRLNEMGYTADWIERQLAHTEPNAVRRTYNHADYLADRTKMMQAWADMLDSWKDGAKVLPIGNKRA
ncbi:tyrosine-type recombinase/integrase [Cupriavidus sp. IDO]|uniref:tyrosine-type recombinase/integrase n=1 Tax=Cupriavidus sp. IDO TaxID=1539142 RepID=UPI0005796EEA|nr:tyrosine-type recombinase/integrase [Cupriavidus sp. IDO]KWR88576.1 integrase [Cupriavidus sp. IDO]